MQPTISMMLLIKISGNGTSISIPFLAMPAPESALLFPLVIVGICDITTTFMCGKVFSWKIKNDEHVNQPISVSSLHEEHGKLPQ